MMTRRRRGDARAPCRFAQREAVDAALLDDCLRCLDQRFAECAMVVAAARGFNLDTVYIITHMSSIQCKDRSRNMLDPATAFSLAGLLAMAAWLALISSLFFRPLRPAALAAAQFVVPAILAVAYILLLWNGRAAFDAGGFGSIAEVRALFA